MIYPRNDCITVINHAVVILRFSYLDANARPYYMIIAPIGVIAWGRILVATACFDRSVVARTSNGKAKPAMLNIVDVYEHLMLDLLSPYTL